VLASYRQGDDAYKQDRYLTYVKTDLSFVDWGKQLRAVYGDRAMLGMLFVPVALFKDLVIRSAKIPILYCYGPKDSGKSTFAESIMYLFFSGKDAMGSPLKPLNFASEPTLSAFWSALERYRNCPMVFNEFDENTVPVWAKTALKSAWDNESRQRMNKDGNGQLESQNVNCAPIIVGQYLADSDDGSVVSRSLVFEFKSRKEKPFTPEEKMRYSTLQDWERQGLSGILTELLPLRERVERDFITTMARVNREFFEYLDTHRTPVQNRTQQNMVCLLTMFDLLGDTIKWPFSREELWEYSRQLIIEMNRLLHESDKLVSFWTTVAYLFGRGEIVSGWDFRIDTVMSVKLKGANGKEERKFEKPRQLLYLRLPNVATPYAEQIRRTSKAEALRENTLLVYLKQTPYYIGAADGIWFVKPNAKGQSTSCLVLDYEMLTNRVEITLEQFEEVEERPVKTYTGLLVGEAKSILIGESNSWQIQLEVTTIEGNRSEQFKVRVIIPEVLIPDPNLLKPDSRWRVTGEYTEQPWQKPETGQKGVNRRIVAHEVEALPPGPVANYIDSTGFNPTPDQPF
jgi:hypothetical protein